MGILIKTSKILDKFVLIISQISKWICLMLMVTICYDVITRYIGVGKIQGINSTMIQELEYWLYSFLIVFHIGYTYNKDGHVRIELFRAKFSQSVKDKVEIFGIVFALIPFSIIGIWLSWPYVLRSYISGEISRSQNGLSNIWILKSGLMIMFLLILIAGISRLIKLSIENKEFS